MQGRIQGFARFANANVPKTVERKKRDPKQKNYDLKNYMLSAHIVWLHTISIYLLIRYEELKSMKLELFEI